MLAVNCGDVVEVLDVRLRPSDRHLRRSVCFVILPSAQYRGVSAASSYSSFCVNGFCMVYLPLVMSVLFSLVTELMLYDSTVFQRCKCCFDFLLGFSSAPPCRKQLLLPNVHPVWDL